MGIFLHGFFSYTLCMAKHCVVFYDSQTGKVKEIKESFLFTHGVDNMSLHCSGENDKLILGVILDDEDIRKKDKMFVVKNFSNNFLGDHYISINGDDDGSEDKKIEIYEKDKIIGKEIIIDCDVFSGTGYGMLSREFMKRIINKDLNIRINPINSSGLFQTCLTNDDNIFSKHFISMDDLSQLDSYIHVRMYPPRINFPRKTYNVAYTMLESYTLSHFYVKMMESSYDRFIVPTHFIKNAFSQYMDSNRISVVPLGVDCDVFNPDVATEDVVFKKIDFKNKIIQPTEEKPSGFRFLSTARFSHRKGCDLILKAFANGFNKIKDDVSLVLFYLPENENNKQHLLNRILDIFSKYDSDKIPPVYLCNDPWPTNKQYLPYGWGDCFVFPSRGEGFGLTPLEAAACKIPVIASNNSGLGDFISGETAFVVPTDKIDDIGRLSQNGYEGNYPEWTKDIFHQHTWNCKFPIMNGQDTIESISSHMRFVYENPNSDTVKTKVENFYKLAKKRFNWDLVSNQLYEELKKYR